LFENIIQLINQSINQNDCSYAKWIQSISKVSRTNHLIFDGKTLQEMSNGSVFSLNFLASARHYLRLHQANPTHFPSTSWMACVKTTGFTQRKRLLIRLQSGLVAHLAQAKLQFQTLHDKEGEFEYSRTGWRPSKKKNEEEEGEQDDEEEMNESNCIIPIQQHCSTVKTQAGPRLVVLGTGSAAPSKLRASSSLYLEVPPIEGQPIQPFGMLLDCGEGTYGQLWRQFGREEVRHRIGALQCIWISHYHADHQCGLVRILQEYLHYQCTMNQTENHGKLLVIAPRSVLTYVDKCKTIGLLSDSHAQLALVSCVDFNRLDHPLRMDFFMRMIHYYPIHELRSVPVIHCYDAFGLVFTIGNTKQKIVYSGDTIPCDRLIHAGLDADLLIHEATFDDSMQEDAEKKKHSTIGQALEVAAKMRAKKTVLTHFSQRYPHLPSQLQDSRFKDEVVCASDGMSISLNLI
jgi:ribonuclease BN (tRNA processing enzyme)